MLEDHRRPELITALNVDISNCDREQVHLCDAVQPHGVLLVIDESNWTVLQVSANSAALIDREPDTLLGQSIASALGEEASASLRDFVGSMPELTATPYCFATLSEGTRVRHFWAHRSPDGRLIVEVEIGAQPSVGFPRVYADVRMAMAHLDKAHSVQEFLGVAVRDIRRFTGYDRVLAYTFLADNSGWVIAEDCDKALETYLGLHYPATDIPEPARRLFSLKWISHLPDVNYDPVPIVPGRQAPIDLSLSLLRSVSPMYRGYLQNMGVHSTLVLTLLKGGTLWGLISCMHHRGPKHVPVSTRVTAEAIARYLSVGLAAREAADESAYRASLRQSEQRLIARIRGDEPLANALTGEDGLSVYFDCMGALACLDGRFHISGECPDAEHLQGLVKWLGETMQDDLYATDRLGTVYPPFRTGSERPAGLLALRLFPRKPDMIIWFRREVERTVNWAGDPNKPVDVVGVSGEERIMPRRSFAVWKQSVRGTSRAWRDSELDAAGDLRRAIIEKVAQQRAEELANANNELMRRNEELDAFAYIASHDLKEPLRGTQAYSQFLLDDYGAILPDEGKRKALVLVQLSKRMEELITALAHYAHVGRIDLEIQSISLESIVASAMQMVHLLVVDAGARVRIASRPFQLSGETWHVQGDLYQFDHERD